MRRLIDRLARDGTLVFGVLFGIAQVVGVVPQMPDFVTYWTGPIPPTFPTSFAPAAGHDAVVYPPPFSLLFAILHLAPWELAIVGWSFVMFGCLWYLARWTTPLWIVVGLTLGKTAFGAPFQVAAEGNVWLVVAAAAVAAFDRAALWSVAAVTKMTPAVGLLWFVARRDWRSVVVAAAATLSLAAVCFVVWPSAWPDYLSFALGNAATVETATPLPPRLILAAILVLVGGWRGWRWTVPVAVGLSPIVFYPWWWVVPVLGIVALYRPKLDSNRASVAVRLPTARPVDPNVAEADAAP